MQDSTFSSKAMAHDIAYDDLLNQVSQDPIPNLGDGTMQATNPALSPTYDESVHPPDTFQPSAFSYPSAYNDFQTTNAIPSNDYTSLTYDWSSFAPCTTTCGQGYKRRIRRCKIPHRCPDNFQEDVQLCYNAPCNGK